MLDDEHVDFTPSTVPPLSEYCLSLADTADLVAARKVARRRINHLNPVPKKSEVETGSISLKTRVTYWLIGLFSFALPKRTSAAHADEHGW